MTDFGQSQRTPTRQAGVFVPGHLDVNEIARLNTTFYERAGKRTKWGHVGEGTFDIEEDDILVRVNDSATPGLPVLACANALCDMPADKLSPGDLAEAEAQVLSKVTAIGVAAEPVPFKRGRYESGVNVDISGVTRARARCRPGDKLALAIDSSVSPELRMGEPSATGTNNKVAFMFRAVDDNAPGELLQLKTLRRLWRELNKGTSAVTDDGAGETPYDKMWVGAEDAMKQYAIITALMVMDRFASQGMITFNLDPKTLPANVKLTLAETATRKAVLEALEKDGDATFNAIKSNTATDARLRDLATIAAYAKILGGLGAEEQSKATGRKAEIEQFATECVASAFCAPYKQQILGKLLFGHDLPSKADPTKRVSASVPVAGGARPDESIVAVLNAQTSNLPGTVKAFVAAHMSQQRLIIAKAITAGDERTTGGKAHVFLGNM